jgi:hypothetical protein
MAAEYRARPTKRDPTFKARVRQIIDEDREILERLAK